MNRIWQDRPSQTAAGVVVFALGAAMAAGPANWPVREVPIYIVPQVAGTYSPFVDKAVVIAPTLAADEFAREIAGVYAALSERQEPLGAEFEAVWDANAADLYES